MKSCCDTLALKLLLLLIQTLYNITSAASDQRLCKNPTVLTQRTTCISCSISLLMPCPSGFKKTPGTLAQDCTYYTKTASLTLPFNGCSFECYKEVEENKCCPGYWGVDCMECPEHADKPCNNNGNCFDGMGGNGTCNCKDGFAGTACEDCSPNRYGPNCGLVCNCLHGLCNNGLLGDGRCTCDSGYKGPNCDKELPECFSLNCQQNSQCMAEAMTGKLVCQCMAGYQRSGTQCISINPCVNHICHAHATCTHTGPNQYICACADGYRGDGHVCMLVDPCQTDQGGCAGGTMCVYDGPGRSHCECIPGVSCSMQDICKPDSCHEKANCSTVQPGTVQCTCLEGYIGNGKVCYGNIMQRMTELNTEPGGQWTGQLNNAIQLFGLLSWPLQNLGPFTVFVPINKGFRGTLVRWHTGFILPRANLIKSLMDDTLKAKYLCKLHMVAGEMSLDTLKRGDVYYTLTGKAGETDVTSTDTQTKIRIHGSRKKGAIVEGDIIASNGIIHIINKLMENISPTVDSDKEENLMKIFSDYGKFSQFKTLLKKANLDSLMDLPGPYTVFAPTNAAFDAMKSGHLQYLSSAEGHSKLVELLRNHIVASTMLEIYNVISSPRVVTMANQVLLFNVSENGRVFVNGMGLLETDVEAKNGRLYSLGGVLTPASIQPVLPHRCDATEIKIVQGECGSCSKAKPKCISGVFTGKSVYGCVYPVTVVSMSVPLKGCAPVCNATVMTPACCKGFYGPECRPCPGGFQNPCSGNGQCIEGINGNGTCICNPSFRGSRCQYCARLDKYGLNCEKTCDCIHGECDNRPDADGRCKADSCLPRFTGQYCERHMQSCGPQIQFCHAHAECDFNQGATMCVCKPGYKGDGITCVESDPCDLPFRGGCSENAKCIKTGPSLHICQCLSGWSWDGWECQPINPCHSPRRGGCHPNASCIYIGPGQSDCMCKTGYQGNGMDCEAANWCVTQNGRGCHYLAKCQLLSNQWSCVCDDGYVGNGEVCYGTVEQELVGLPEATEFSKWVTDAGLSQLLAEPNITLLVPTSAAIDNLATDDKNFWTTKGNVPSIVRNHIIQGNYPLSTLRTPVVPAKVTSLLKESHLIFTTNLSTTIGGATILLANVATTNGLIHVIDKVLVPERKLSEGLLEVLDLRPEFSLFRAFLMEHNLTDEIEQTDEYTIFAPINQAVNNYLQTMAATILDVNTTRYHIVTSERLLKTDLQTGGYKETLLGFSYQLGIFLKDGKLFVNNAQLNVSNIMTGKGVIHGLSSVLEIRRNRCDMTQYREMMGTCQDCFHPQGKVCPSGTVPKKIAKKKRCMFSRTFDGERLHYMGCLFYCTKTTIVRKCCSGFFGEHCESCPSFSGLPCFGNGVCSDGTNGTGVCHCNQYFNGTACESCVTGKYGIHCDQDCVCKNGRCSDGPEGDGMCECNAGWTGVLCDEKIESKADELCGLVVCHTSANCKIKPSGMKCFCAAGFEGNGTYCKAIDLCKVNNGGCSPYAVCKRTQPGQRKCACNPGYAGDGLVCVEINPCLDGSGGCHANAQCIHTGPNKTLCTCNHGYSGDGQNCKIINLCQKKNGECHRYAKCNMTGPGLHNCTCYSGYIGDGITCKGTVGKELINRKLMNFYVALMFADISLRGRGPMTVFAPTAKAFAKYGLAPTNIFSSRKTLLPHIKDKETYANIFRNHIVLCHTLTARDLATPRNLTTLTGEVLSTTSSQGSIFINKANITYSDDISSNGIIHEIDTILMPSNVRKGAASSEPVHTLNLTDVATGNGYKSFYKLMEETGVMDQVNNHVNQPVTMLLPSDQAMSSLPREQRDFLFNPHNRAQLLDYLKYHIIPLRKVYALELIHLDSARSLQGSPLAFSCGGINTIGEIFINGEKCRIIQRHLVFNGGIAYGIDCLLTPPSVGGHCDEQKSFELSMNCGPCSPLSSRCPDGSKVKDVQKCDLPMVSVTKFSGCRTTCIVNIWQPRCCAGYYGRDCLACPGGLGSVCSNRGNCDDGHLGNGTCKCKLGFQGVACELCKEGHYGHTCKACNCTEHGSCDEGLKGRGVCFCEKGWTGERCDQQDNVPVCFPSCSPKGVCQHNNTCVCGSFYEGDGFTCTLVDICASRNGGCAKGAKCLQKGEKLSCTCPAGHSGDGFSCQPTDACALEENGGCHEHATCTMTGPGKKRCACKDRYIGDGMNCEVKELPINRCLQDNGLCHQDAKCTDLHFEDATVGVFHIRSDKGQYKLNYTAAQEACSGRGSTVATYTQLSYAQQAGFNLCSAGWLDQGRVAYPTTYSNPNCGFGHVGIVDYGTRINLSETWDTFCHRVKEVKCECKPGYIGDGYSCTGNLMQVLTYRAFFSNFLTQILNYSRNSDSGKEFVRRLNNLTVQSTLFVPDNSGLYDNQTLTQRDIEYHLSEGQALALSELKNGSKIQTRLGSLTVLGVADFLNPKAMSSRYINDRFITDSDILASNGIIHVLQGPLKAPPPHLAHHVAHKAGMGVGVLLLVFLVAVVICVGYHFYMHKTKPFKFHYFKDEGEADVSVPPNRQPNISNPMYDAAPMPVEPETCGHSAEDMHGGTYDLLQN